jgi:hypothetical protein
MVSFIVVPLVAVTTLRASTTEVGLLAALGPLPARLFGAHVGAWIDCAGREITTMRVAALLRTAVLAGVPGANRPGASSDGLPAFWSDAAPNRSHSSPVAISALIPPSRSRRP